MKLITKLPCTTIEQVKAQVERILRTSDTTRIQIYFDYKRYVYIVKYKEEVEI